MAVQALVPPVRAALTPREIQVADARASGKSLKEVASALSISTNTVKTHMRSIYDKLGIQTVYDLYVLIGPLSTGLLTASSSPDRRAPSPTRAPAAVRPGLLRA